MSQCIFHLTEINECIANTHKCDSRPGVGICTNKAGVGYDCSCSAKYTLASDNKTCNGRLKVFESYLIEHVVK